MAKADMFITYFEIGNVRLLFTVFRSLLARSKAPAKLRQCTTVSSTCTSLTRWYALTAQYVSLSVLQWLHAIVGVNAGFTDVASTADMREWAKERNVDYFEVTVNDGPSVDEMLTELIRKARLLPERVRSIRPAQHTCLWRADRGGRREGVECNGRCAPEADAAIGCAEQGSHRFEREGGQGKEQVGSKGQVEAVAGVPAGLGASY